MTTDQVGPPGAIRCSYVDESLQVCVPVLAFFYRERLDAARLAEGLARVLADFPAYAGRLAWRDGALYIEPSQDGVRFEEQASVEPVQSLTAAARSGDYKALVPPLSVRRMLRGGEPLLAVRLTNAPGGCVLAFAFNHALGDLTSSMLLLRAWSNACRGLAYDKPLHVPDRHRYLLQHLPDAPDARASLRLFAPSEMLRVARHATTRKRRVELRFEAGELERIQRAASRQREVSRHDALCAHVALALRQLDPRAPRHQLSVVIDYRRRLGLPANAPGNLISMVQVPLPARSDDLPRVAAELRQAIERFAERPDYLPTARLLSAHTSAVERLRCLPLAADPRVAALVLVSWTGQGVSDLVFESQRPALFLPLGRTAVPYVGSCHESSEASERTVSLCLPDHVAAVLDTERGRGLVHRYADEPVRAAASGSAAPPFS